MSEKHFLKFMASYEIQDKTFEVEGRVRSYKSDMQQWREYVNKVYTKASGFDGTDIDEEEFKDYIRGQLKLPASDGEISDLFKRLAKDGGIEIDKFRDMVNGYPLPMPSQSQSKTPQQE